MSYFWDDLNLYVLKFLLLNILFVIFFFILVSLQDIQLRKAFRSSQAFDQQVVSRDTMPKAMLEAYMACDKPPPLDKLNPYRYVNFTSTFCLL